MQVGGCKVVKSLEHAMGKREKPQGTRVGFTSIVVIACVELECGCEIMDRKWYV